MQTNANDGGKDWLRSWEVRKMLQLTTCQLTHLRTKGEIEFRKSGNAYLYSASDCGRIAGGEACKQDEQMQPWEMSLTEWEKLAEDGRLVAATGEYTEKENELERRGRLGENITPFHYGEAAGYSSKDIAHFYLNYHKHSGGSASSAHKQYLAHAITAGKAVPPDALKEQSGTSGVVSD